MVVPIKSLRSLVCLVVMLAALAPAAPAQTPVPPPTPAFAPLSDPQLDQLIEPIALYPDPLIAIMLPAATLPTEIVLADRYVSGGGDPNAIAQQPWDPNVQALAHYPTVLQWMDQNLDWTTELGQAFMNQQEAVTDSIQRLRQMAYNLGNLPSTPQQQVINDGGYIEIVPVDDQDVYVPAYQPDEVYYVAGNGAPFITFGAACAIGPWLIGDFDWRAHHVIFWNPDHPRPGGWWQAPRANRDVRGTQVWHPASHNDGRSIAGADRGWDNAPATVRPGGDFRVPQAPAVKPGRIEPEQNRQVEAPPARREPNDAFIGVQSSHETSAYSERGRASLQNAGRAPAVLRPPASVGGNRPEGPARR